MAGNSAERILGLGSTDFGVRRFGRVNWLGLWTLTEREMRRFLVVWTQTILAPLVTAGLFLAIFTLAIGPQRGEVMGVPFAAFLAPGLMMMTVIQNAFANTSSSLMISKVQGNIVDTLMPPLSPAELVTGYLAGGVARGIVVAVSIVVGMILVLNVTVAHPLWMLVFVILGSAFMGALGLIAAIVAVKFDHMAAITNFIVMPLAFLSGTFYSADALPGVMNQLIHLNPIFYFIDGARYGVIGVSDTSPWIGLVFGLVSTLGVVWISWALFRSGYRLKA